MKAAAAGFSMKSGASSKTGPPERIGSGEDCTVMSLSETGLAYQFPRKSRLGTTYVIVNSFFSTNF